MDEPGSEPARDVANRARNLWQRAAPALRDVNAAIERHGLDAVRDDIVERAGGVAKRVSDVVANATAIEGTVVERTPTPDDAVASEAPAAGAPRMRDLPADRTRRSIRWHYVGLVVGLTVFGAAVVQHRRHD